MKKKQSLSASIITFNEEKNLERCLLSIKDICHEIIIVDSLSSDSTLKIAREFGCKIFSQPFLGHIKQKQLALEKCTGDWILCIDADEAVSEELKREIMRFVSSNPEIHGISINRLSNYFGKWMKFVWQPDWNIRLIRNGYAYWGGYNPHDKIIVKGKTDRLKGYLYHYPYKDIMDHFNKTIKYSSIIAEEYYKMGIKARWYHLLFSPHIAIFKKLILKFGILDGIRGIIISSLTGWGVFIKYFNLFVLQRQKYFEKF
ncbi:MAG: glycosyltransferase family 2 protein [Thermodesulfobacteriota bacterium]|nr:glycosyltransferase family 2 protein [Thermodesulfobacteriota bacterium]